MKAKNQKLKRSYSEMKYQKLSEVIRREVSEAN